MMASVQKIARGYRAQVKTCGVRDSRMFATRRDSVSKPVGELQSLRDTLRCYAREVSPHKRGQRRERLRLSAFEGYRLSLDSPIAKVTAQHIADFSGRAACDCESGQCVAGIDLAVFSV